MTSVTTHFQKLTTTKTTCLVSQLFSKVTVTSCSFTSNVQCVHLAAGRRIQARDATDQWRDIMKRRDSLPGPLGDISR